MNPAIYNAFGGSWYGPVAIAQLVGDCRVKSVAAALSTAVEAALWVWRSLTISAKGGSLRSDDPQFQQRRRAFRSHDHMVEQWKANRGAGDVDFGRH